MDKRINIQELLDWYIWAGVTETCSDLVCLNGENKNESVIQVSKIPTPNNKQLPSKNEFTLSQNAKDLCQKANNIQELKDILDKFDGCSLKKTATNTVFGSGSCCAKLMFIGEAPGADEDRCGEPFVGRCGKLLDKIFESIQIKRGDCYITNVLPWRPPGNRTPTDEEIAVCLPFLKKQIELINPDILVLLGGIALKSLMNSNDPISRTRGKWLEYEINSNKKIPVLATYHPSYLLRSPAQKSKTWIDFIRLKKKLYESS